jgi:glycogen/starch synthases, ADP-glucose type
MAKNILFVAAEAVPFVKTGGLADVIGSLPKELVRQGVQVRVILPKYGDIPAAWREQMAYITHLEIPVGWRRLYCGIERLEHQGVTYYFIDNEYYFHRQGLYGFDDDGERFTYFCRAVLEALPYLDFVPDVLHCHDWHTAMVPVLLHAHYRSRAAYDTLRTVLTIHNIQYQGVFDPGVLDDLLDLNAAEYLTADRLEFFGKVNFLKGGIAFADAVTTVSRTYAWEILTPEGGWQLDGILKKRENDLCGILNGLDWEVYDPGHDKLIDTRYTRRSLGRRQTNKAKLQEYLGLTVRPEAMMIAIVSRLVWAKGFDLIAEVLDEILADDVQMVVLGTGEDKYESMFRVAGHRHPGKLSANIFFDEALAHKIYASADLFLMPSLQEPCGIGQLIALRYGCLPLVRETGGLKDTIQPYNEYTGDGNGFSFTSPNARDMLYTIQRAMSFYRSGEVWSQIVKAAMASDFSWRRSATEYVAVYERLT